jgi:hypothetical protein
MNLVGSWTIDLLSSDAGEAYGDVSMEFAADGELIYTRHQPEADSVAVLEWRLEGSTLVTLHPAPLPPQHTPARIDEAGRLILGTPGDEAVFLRMGPAAPSAA